MEGSEINQEKIAYMISEFALCKKDINVNLLCEAPYNMCSLVENKSKQFLDNSFQTDIILSTCMPLVYAQYTNGYSLELCSNYVAIEHLKLDKHLPWFYTYQMVPKFFNINFLYSIKLIIQFVLKFETAKMRRENENYQRIEKWQKLESGFPRNCEKICVRVSFLSTTRCAACVLHSSSYEHICNIRPNEIKLRISNVGIHKRNNPAFVFLVQHAISELKLENQLDSDYTFFHVSCD